MERSNALQERPPVRIGVIGVGRIGSFHAGVLRAQPGVRQVLLLDADEARAAAVAAEHGVGVAPSLDALLAASDAVVITTPTATHADLLYQVAEAGRPTFCEKPITVDLASTEAVIRHIRGRKAVVQMGFQRRFDPGYRRVQEMVSSGALGRLYVVRMSGHDPNPPHEEYIPGSGGIFRDLHIHDFDIARFVTGQEVTEVYADGDLSGFEAFGRYGDVATAVATLRFSGGTLGILSGTRHNPLGYDIRLEAFGSGDSVAAGWDARTPLRSVEPDGLPAPVSPYSFFLDRFGPAYRAELEAFLEVVAGRRPNPCPPEEAREAIRVAMACDLSREQHRPVRVAEVG
ncbi:MAG TPA: Gfo/Idh/MocA family oxidoreductase [Gemmatimonadales bacterium]|nr:Gfo/Idh/MocA family oxidoreductase [Gemmatimonadales bacterium]